MEDNNVSGSDNNNNNPNVSGFWLKNGKGETSFIKLRPEQKVVILKPPTSVNPELLKVIEEYKKTGVPAKPYIPLPGEMLDEPKKSKKTEPTIFIDPDECNPFTNQNIQYSDDEDRPIIVFDRKQQASKEYFSTIRQRWCQLINMYENQFNNPSFFYGDLNMLEEWQIYPTHYPDYQDWIPILTFTLIDSNNDAKQRVTFYENCKKNSARCGKILELTIDTVEKLMHFNIIADNTKTILKKYKFLKDYISTFDFKKKNVKPIIVDHIE
jgi:hypothetical protein